MTKSDSRRVLAVASSGGHWQQMRLLSPAFAGTDHYFATTAARSDGDPASRTFSISDCNRNDILGNLRALRDVIRVVYRTWPHVVISTGAAPGLLAILIGKLVGARTIWVDSVANSERLSMSGKLAGYIADLHLSQWRHVARQSGAGYLGSVL